MGSSVIERWIVRRLAGLRSRLRRVLRRRAAALGNLATRLFPRLCRAVAWLLEALPHTIRPYGMAGSLRHQLGQTPAAIVNWERARDRHPRRTAPRLHLAAAYVRLGRHREAAVELRHVLRRASDDPVRLLAAARLAAAADDSGLAEEICQRSLSLNPRNRPARVILARQHVRNGAVPEAETELTRLLQDNPHDIDALLTMGRLRFNQRRWDEAIDFVQQVKRLDPGHPEPYVQLARSHMRMDREAQAAALYAEAALRFAGSADGHLTLGRIMQYVPVVAAAEAHFRRAARLAPKDPTPWINLGRFLLAEGLVSAAHHALAQGVERGHSPTLVESERLRLENVVRLLGLSPETDSEATDAGSDVRLPERLIEEIMAMAHSRPAPARGAVAGRIVMVTASLGPGGAERQVVNTLRGLRSRHGTAGNLHLLCASLSVGERDSSLLSEVRALGVPCHEYIDYRAPAPELTGSAYAAFQPLVALLPPAMQRAIASLVVRLSDLRPETVHAWQDTTNLYAAVAAAIVGVPRIVLSTRSVRPDEKRRRRHRYFADVYRCCLHYPGLTVLNNSVYGARDYAQWLGVDSSLVTVVRNGMDLAALTAGAEEMAVDRLRRQLNLTPDNLVVGTAFRMTDEKRPLLWVDVAREVSRRVPGTHFLVLGDGPMHAQMESWATQSGLSARFHFVGHQAPVGAWFKLMDLFLLTSRIEGLPNVLIEAQALGIPAIATDAGGAAETFIDGQTGWLLRTSSAAQIAERAAWCLEHARWRKEAAAKARLFAAETFGLDRMVDATLAAYQQTGNATDRAPTTAGERARP